MTTNLYSKEWKRIAVETQEVIKGFHCEAPVKIGAIAKSLGLIVKKSTLSARISGEIRKEGNDVVIRVNRHDAISRQRFTIAHEIAHFLLHSEYIGDGIVDDVLYRSTLSNTMESEANRLAADLLMPNSLLVDCFKTHSVLNKDMRVEKIAEDLNVSVTALKIRIGDKYAI
jgi:Zn-dependent peptidase ImmA (M78 family)